MTVIAIVIDRGRGYRDLIQFLRWHETIKLGRQLLAEWQKEAAYLQNVGFTDDFIPLRHARDNITHLQQQLQELEVDI